MRIEDKDNGQIVIEAGWLLFPQMRTTEYEEIAKRFTKHFETLNKKTEWQKDIEIINTLPNETTNE